MKASVYLSDGAVLDFEDFEDDTALDLRAALDDGARFLTFDMDGATVLVNADHLVRVDYERP